MNCNILDFIVNKEELITESLQNAIDKAAENGGGRVIIPAGNYKSGSIELKSNVTLYLEDGAVLTASENISDYRYVGYYHSELGDVRSFIFAMNSKNIGIEGNGTINLSGDTFYDFSRPLIPENMKDIITEEQKQECTVHFDERINQPIFIYHCENVKIKDVVVTNSPCWTLTFAECTNLKIMDITIKNSLVIPNNDGIHLCSCNGVVIKGCNITSADDCIAVTAITNWDKPCENITISDCILVTCSKALVLGYMYSIVRNVTVTNVIINESNRGLCIMSNPKFGIVENVVFNNCVVDTKIRAGNWWGNGEPICIMAVTHNFHVQHSREMTFDTSVRNVIFSNITCNSENLIGIVGEGRNITDIDLTHIKIQLKESKNKNLKGNVVDLSPGKQIPTIPDDGVEYSMLIMDAENIKVSAFNGKTAIINSEVDFYE